MAPRIVHPSELSYIRHELDTGNPTRQKVILQHLSKRFASGFRLNSKDAISIQTLISGISLTTLDRKALRWSLNVLALFGQSQFAIPSATHALGRFPDDPDILSSALSAIAASDLSKFHDLTRSENYPRELITLSALRNVPAKDVDTSEVQIDIEVAEPGTLKLALLTVGLDRAPENIFHPRHDNAQIVKTLGSHHDPIVSQYSVWAIAENDDLGIDDLGIRVEHIDDYPPNVRGWTYRLYGSATSAPSHRHDLIVRGSEDTDSDARSGLARGLRDNWYDGLEEVTTRWYLDERDHEVKAQVLDHLARQAHLSPAYEQLVKDVYASEASNIELRERMEASAAGTRIYGELKSMSAAENAGFFNVTLFGEMNVANSPINIGTAAVAIGSGSATNYGTNSNLLAPEKIAVAMPQLEAAEALVRTLPLDQSAKEPAIAAIAEAKKAPTPEKIGGVAMLLKGIQESLASVAGATDHALKIGAFIATLLGLLPK